MEINENLCVGCFACQDACPKSAIGININTGLPVILAEYCQRCGECAGVCPNHAIDE
jgi:Fe-S-cluster-containing hydrogenase component 2